MICLSTGIPDELVARCNDRLEIRPIVGGDITEHQFFRKYVRGHFETPNARLIQKQGFYFGNNPDLTRKEIESILKILG